MHFILMSVLLLAAAWIGISLVISARKKVAGLEEETLAEAETKRKLREAAAEEKREAAAIELKMTKLKGKIRNYNKMKGAVKKFRDYDLDGLDC